MTTAHQAYNLYMTTKKHFTNIKYSAFKNKPVSIPSSRFTFRPERYRMERLAKRFSSPKELIQYFVANFALDTGDFLYQPEEYGDSSYMRWEAYKQSLSYNFKNEVEFIRELCESKSVSPLAVTTGVSPILQLYIAGKISVQCVVLLDEIYNFLTSENDSVTMNPLYVTFVLRAQKAKGFIKFDKPTIENIARGLESKEYEYA